MRSEIELVDEWIDLPSLTEFKGDDNFERIGSVILESMDVVFDWFRYPSIIIHVLYASIPISLFFSTTSITLTLIHFHSNLLIPFHFILLIQFQFLFWLLIITRSVVPCASLTDTLSSLPSLFSFLYFPSYTSHSSLFFASHYRVSTMNSVSCLFGYSLTHVHLLCW